MPDLADGESTEVKGSSGTYTLKNEGGVYSCTCPAWRHQNAAIEKRTCKHLRALRGDEAEKARLGTAELTGKPARAKKPTAEGEDEAEGEGPPILLAHRWENDVDLVGWWMSEKLDGVRAYWDGERFLSRLGNQFHAPGWFTEGLPDHPLDGELWGGRKAFQRTVGIVKRQDMPAAWKDIAFLVFDAPAHGGLFEERLAHLSATIGKGGHAYARVHDHELCRGEAHLREELARVEALGGEGLMLRKPRSVYEVGRSSTLLKVKTFHDAEARVVDHVAGAGRHKGRLGALVVELGDGTRFNVGTGFSDAEREAPPEIGALITFRYQELSNAGVPRFPSFVGVRSDAKKASVALPKSAPAAAKPAPTPKAPAPNASPLKPAAAGARYFELVEGTSSKFWEITIAGCDYTTRYGRIGASGQSTTKTASSPEGAQREADKLVAEKTKKGYVERSS
jgi:DNA ligase-1